ncbi:alpha/beta hydrolase [Planosporangium thailandense]|uniref:alpha/beta hydrolase n=1 Tax=Planosporangium thailandense TaxID=765197 RepID=UPI00197CACDF|nr:alpha/beta hydrolase [Planosporangium thailandense]
MTRRPPGPVAKAVGACTLVLAGLAASTPAVAAPSAGERLTAPALTATENSSYARQKLSWHKCFAEPPEGAPPGAERLECATMRAPLNWGQPGADQYVEIAVSRLRPATAQPRGTLFINPGGPGGPGLTMPLVLLQRSAVADAYELVGFDVRGTGQSTNVTCGGTSTSPNDPRDRSKTNLDLMHDAADVFVRHCVYRSGPLLRYVTTEQTVRDLDLLRHLLGWQKISWVGYSGGTWLGAYYATFFPGHVDRFVLDSNTEFTAPWQSSFGWQPLGFERRFREDFATWAAGYDTRFHLGGTADDVRRFYERLRADVVRDPLLFLGLIPIDGPVLDGVILQSMYSKQSFQPLAELLQELRAQVDARAAGSPPPALSAAARATLDAARRTSPDLLPVAAADAFPATFFAITCQDTPWNRSRQFWEKESARQGSQYPLAGWASVAHPCAAWPRPNITLPKPTGRGVPPVLMVESTHDPATPYEGAVRAHRAFAGSRLLTVTNEGDHGIYTMGNQCVDGLVDTFLLTGALPATDTECAGTGIPAPTDPSQPQAFARRLPANPLQLNEYYTKVAGPTTR